MMLKFKYLMNLPEASLGVSIYHLDHFRSKLRGIRPKKRIKKEAENDENVNSVFL